MRLKALVVTANDGSYQAKNGPKAGQLVKQAVATFLDRCPHSPMKDTFDLKLPGVDVGHFNSQFNGKTVEVDVSTFEIFAGRLQAGLGSKIVGFDSDALPTKPSGPADDKGAK